MTSPRQRWLSRAAGCVLLLAGASVATGQQISLREYTREDGLGNLSVFALLEDRSGALWAATEGGLYRNQGSGFEQFGADQGILDLQISALHEDAPGSLWAAGQMRLYHREDSRFVRVQLRGVDIPIVEGQRLASTPAGDVLVASRGQLLRISRQAGGVWVAEPFFKPEAIRAMPDLAAVHAVFSSPGLGTWFGCGAALCQLTGADVQRWGEEQGVPDDTWESIHEDRDSRLWVRGYHHLRALPRGAKVFLPHEIPWQSGLASPLQGFAEDREGAILTRSDAGVARWKDGAWTVFDAQNGLPPYGIASMLVDHDGLLWLVTRGSGVLRWIGYGEWESWTDKQGLPSTLVWAPLRESPSRLIVANDGITMALDSGARTLVPWPPGPLSPQKQVNSLARTPDGAIWSASYSGEVTRFDPASGERTYIPGLPITPRLFVDSRGRLWILTTAGINQIEAGTTIPRRVSSPVVPSERFSDAAEAPDGALYFVSASGLYRYRDDRWTHITIDDPQAQVGIISVACSAKGALWIAGALPGVLQLEVHGDRGQPLRWWSAPQISSRNILFLRFDLRGWLWSGTDAGVDVFNGSRWRHLSAADGLLWDDMDEGAFEADPDGSVWLGTSRGLSHLLHPETLFTLPVLDVRLDAAAVGTTPLAADSNTEVAWTKAALTIDFGSSSFRFEKSLRFRYRLTGIDDDWQETRAHSLRYPSLPSGNYRFELQAIERSTGASSALVTFSLRVLAPWWRSELLLGGLVALLAGVVAFGFRLRTRSMLKEQQRLERLVAERTGELESEKRDLAEARDALVIRATRDALTGLWNREAIVERLEYEFVRAHRQDLSLVVVLADLDHFKAINDTFGHSAGDAVLREVARRLSTRVRPYDLVGRYGGEELLLIMPGLGITAAADRVTMLHRAISDDPVVYEQLTIPVTFSCGVALRRADTASPLQMVDEADRALYRAKALGRNHVELAWAPGNGTSRAPIQGMNDDEMKGKVKDIKGRVKDAAGAITGDKDLQKEGKAERVEGNIQEKYGEAKRKVGEAIEDLGDKVKR